jgi:hypothetical protein
MHSLKIKGVLVSAVDPTSSVTFAVPLGTPLGQSMPFCPVESSECSDGHSEFELLRLLGEWRADVDDRDADGDYGGAFTSDTGLFAVSS